METASRSQIVKQNGLFARYVILAGFIAGSLDALAAIFILSHGDASSIFKFVASGFYGAAAFSGGAYMVGLGVAIHYFIAFSVAMFYFSISKYGRIFHKNILVTAILYGIFIYIVMNVLVMSISNVHIANRTLISILRNVGILIVCIALPIVYFKRVYDSKQKFE